MSPRRLHSFFSSTYDMPAYLRGGDGDGSRGPRLAFPFFDDEPCADGDLVPCDGCSAHVRLVA